MRNRYGFGLGTLGRDMVAAMVSMYLLFYLTEVLDVPDAMMGAVTAVFVATRVFDAVNDPLMGLVVDNTRTRWGKFKPWIVIGAVTWALMTVLIFTDFGFTGVGFLVAFALTYLVWEIAYTINDIAFWSMLPALSQDQKERERIGAVARICANIGLFALVVGLVPVTRALGEALGNLQRGWWVLAVIVSVLMLLGQAIPVFLVREQVIPSAADAASNTSPRELLSVIGRNDQLLWISVAMLAFMTGYTTTTSFGLYWFKYIYADEGAYAMFALILGVTQLTALVLFPLFSRRWTRRRLHLFATTLAAAGYVVFWFADVSIVMVSLAGVLLFFGQGIIQLLMLMFIADSVEYGEWKLGRRNESITLSLQPLIYKGANALATGMVGVTLIVSGITAAQGPQDLTDQGRLIFKVAMLAAPLVLVILSYAVAAAKYRIDEKFFAEIRARIGSRTLPAEPPTVPARRFTQPSHLAPTLGAKPTVGRAVMARQVLIVDDEPQIRTVLRAYLEAEGFSVTEAGTGADALNRAAAADLLLLDVGLPDLSGLDVLTKLRATSDVYVILVTARAEEVDKLVGLSVGADDYITKPFSPREVVARVRSVLRRARPEAEASDSEDGVLAFDGLVMDGPRREVRVDERAVELSALDFDLLWALASAPGRVYSRAQLLEKVWGYDFYGDERVVDVHIRSMRSALGDDATAPRIIGTVRGVGYKFLLRAQEG